jgi:hypothetical protein
VVEGDILLTRAPALTWKDRVELIESAIGHVIEIAPRGKKNREAVEALRRAQNSASMALRILK